jgi:hypothetical protein
LRDRQDDLSVKEGSLTSPMLLESGGVQRFQS